MNFFYREGWGIDKNVLKIVKAYIFIGAGAVAGQETEPKPVKYS